MTRPSAVWRTQPHNPAIDITGLFESRPLSGDLFSRWSKPVNLCYDTGSPTQVEIAGGATGSQGAVLQICGEQEFLADLKREGYACEMLILPNRIQ
jgi:hypothetical protein